MADSAKSTTYAIFGHYGNENLGDEAIIQAIIGNIRQHNADAQIVCLSINAVDSGQRFGVTAYPIRDISPPAVTHAQQITNYYEQHGSDTWAMQQEDNTPEAPTGIKAQIKKIPLLVPFVRLVSDFPALIKALIGELKFLKLCYTRCKKIDVLFITGSNQFLDNFGGTWGFPYTLLKWSVLAKIAGTKIGILCVGAGPLDKALSKLMVRRTIRMCDYLSFRDNASKQLIEQHGFKSYGKVYPDLAHSLLTPKISNNPVKPKDPNRRSIVGINPMPVNDGRYWHETDQQKANTFYRATGELAAKIVKDGYDVFFFPTHPKDEYSIRDIIHIMKEQLGDQIGDMEQYIKRPSSVDDLVDVYLSADLIIATRFHGVLLSLLCERPVLGICYHRKTDDLLRDMGQQDYSVDLLTLDATDAHHRFGQLSQNRITEIEKIKKANIQNRQSLQEQYQMLFKQFP